jgi:hypothetical protein
VRAWSTPAVLVALAASCSTDDAAPASCADCDVELVQALPADGATNISLDASVRATVGPGYYASVDVYDDAGRRVGGGMGENEVIVDFDAPLAPSTTHVVEYKLGCGTENVEVCMTLSSAFTTGDGGGTSTTPTPTTSWSGVDVVLVLDDSNSMGPAQLAWVDALPTLVDTLAGADPRFAVVTTTFQDDAPPPTFFGPDDLEALRGAASVGTGGDDREQGVRTAAAALASGALRDDAWVSVILLTDEEDCSHDGLLDDAPQEDCYLRMDELPEPSELLSTLHDALGRSSMDVHGILGVEGSSCDAWPSERLAELTDRSGGTRHDICAPSFDDTAAAIATAILGRVEPR